MKQFMNDHPLQAPVVLASVMLAAFGAKLGLGLWAIGGLVCFYPSYLALLVAGRGAGTQLARWRRIRPS